MKGTHLKTFIPEKTKTTPLIQEVYCIVQWSYFNAICFRSIKFNPVINKVTEVRIQWIEYVLKLVVSSNNQLNNISN